MKPIGRNHERSKTKQEQPRATTKWFEAVPVFDAIIQVRVLQRQRQTALTSKPAERLRQDMKSLPANVRATHVAMRWQNRVRIMAACARVALPFGVSVAALVPVTRPSALAQRMASTAQEPACAASVYLLRSAFSVVS